jgi:conjugal transfer pilus assembly protein TraB
MGTQILPDPTRKGRSNFPPSPLGSSAQELNPQQLTPPVPQIEVIDFKEGTVEGGNTTGTTAAQDHRAVSSPAEKETFIPATTFVRALLLNGVDAPTGGQAQGNPLPITLQIIDAANLPNKNKINLKGCRFLGAAWGDLSSERMLARVEDMSCVINGKSVVVPVRGYVIGEDGKTGVRGRLVSKQGQALANSLLAGVASSTANVFAAGSSSQSVSTNALGGTTTTKVVDQDELKRAAIGGGLSSAAQNLAEYYIRQAEKMYPVIETDAGRIVEVLITDGVAFPLTNSDKRVKPSEKRVLSND